MTHNQKVLAQIVAHHAVQRASRADVRPPQERVMEALGEAIDSKRKEVQAFVLAGRIQTDKYRAAKA
ncbi:Lipopolysaccharide assembly protein B (plasmid) [Burkholderia sp. AD24]|nr:Lipopolysaccharide assembly protein B [Burkholderia sp. AD24]